MAHHIYHTEAIIFGGRISGEADRILYCYTRELGLVEAMARSVREGRSKLRYALQTFAHVDVDLVRGKSGWKITSARPVASFEDIWSNAQKRRLLAQYVVLSRRLIQGQESHSAFFDDIICGLKFLSSAPNSDIFSDIELLFVIRLLSSLGYWGRDENTALLFSNGPWSFDLVLSVGAQRSFLLRKVNSALASSHL